MKEALRIASIRAIRTFMQTAAGGLAGIGAITAISSSILTAYGEATALVLIGAAMAALIAFCQNFAEALPE